MQIRIPNKELHKKVTKAKEECFMDGTIGEYYLAVLPLVQGEDASPQIMSNSTGETGKQEILQFIHDNQWTDAKIYHWVNDEWAEVVGRPCIDTKPGLSD